MRNSGNITVSKLNTRAGTIAICIGLLLVYIVLPSSDPNTTFRAAAFMIGTVLAVALILEARSGFRTVLRTDILMLVALYGLTFLEFLFPQPDLSDILSPEAAAAGTDAVLLGFVGIALGRHLVPRGRATSAELRNLSPGVLFKLFLGCFIIGYFHMFLAVNFDPIEVVRQMTYPRFSQAWTRGQLGNWSALLNELGLLIYLLPPIGGLVLARSEEFKPSQRLVVLVILAFTFFYGFSSGTRNIFIIFLLTFASSYLTFRRRLNRWQIGFSIAAVIALTLSGTFVMLEFRRVGLADYSIAAETQPEGLFTKSEGLFVDNNIVAISKLTEVFPDAVDFLGTEVPFQALTKPIPRALWPSKPEGLSFGPENVFEASQTTISSTFIGESYMAYGFLGVAFTSVLLGALAGWWNRRGHDLNSNFKLLLYVSGFFAAALSMRSILQVLPAVLPTLALWAYGKIWLRKELSARPRRLLVEIEARPHVNQPRWER